jgi:hypothetical protein
MFLIGKYHIKWSDFGNLAPVEVHNVDVFDILLLDRFLIDFENCCLFQNEGIFLKIQLLIYFFRAIGTVPEKMEIEKLCSVLRKGFLVNPDFGNLIE